MWNLSRLNVAREEKKAEKKESTGEREREKAKRKHHIIFVFHSYVMKDARVTSRALTQRYTLRPGCDRGAGAMEEETRVT